MSAPVRLPTLEDVQAEQAHRHLRDYLRLICWPVIEPQTKFVGGWHIDGICDHLEAVKRRLIRNLLITVPPRHTKSITMSIAFPTWAWIDDSWLRFLYSSFSAELSTEHAVLSRRVIESARYQQLWGDRFQLTTDQNVKTHYENTKRGYRISTSVGGTTTGRGADILLVDDPHNLKTIQSDPERIGVLEWYRMVWSTRLNDPKTGCRVYIMQRGKEDDLAGYLLEQGDIEHLNLPTEYEPTPFVEMQGTKAMLTGHVATEDEKTAAESAALAREGVESVDNRILVSAIGWKDPRSASGELLCPDRFGPAEVTQAKRDLGATGFATQHQQRPVPQEGGLFKRAKLTVVSQSALPVGIAYSECRGWDIASTEEKPGTDPDYTAGVKVRRYADGRYVVMHVVHGRFGPAEGDTVMRSTAVADGRYCRQREEREGGASGKKVIASHVQLFDGFDYRGETVSGSKALRATPFAVQVDNDHVWLLEGAWNQTYIDELILFPNGRHDDQVDGSSVAYNELALGPAPPSVHVSGVGVERTSPWTGGQMCDETE